MFFSYYIRGGGVIYISLRCSA